MDRSIDLIRYAAAVVTIASLLGLGVDLARTAYGASHTAHAVVLAKA
jgi:hypothetical protein